MQHYNIKLNLHGAKRVVTGHPWVRIKDLNSFRQPPPAGEVVRLQDAAGNFLGHALSEGTTGEVAYRLLSRERHPEFDEAWWMSRVEIALGLRRKRLSAEPDGVCRLLNGDNDSLPGVFCDKFGAYAVIDVLSPGIMPYLYYIERALQQNLRLRGLLRKVRFKDGTRTADKDNVVPEPVFGEVPQERLMVTEGKQRFWVNLWDGAHEGLFLDQRANRDLVAGVAKGESVLNGFCYTGAFSVACLAGGAAQTVNVDIARKALDWAKDNMVLNAMDPAAQEWHAAEMFEILGAWAKKDRRFGLVIMDPPPYSRHKNGVFKASRDYAKLAQRSLAVVRVGGHAAFSCGTQDYGRASFMKHLNEACIASGVEASLVAMGVRGEDFPALKGFPEGDHQKMALIKVLAEKGAGQGTLTGMPVYG
jgi:23S rRNA (cytosine1962-C5)-methyltransferase